MRFMSISLIVVCLFLGCGADKIETPSQVEILTLLDSPVFQFARGELAEFLQKTGELAVVDTIDTKVKRWRFVLQTNELLPPYSFQIQYIKGNREYGLLLEGHDPTCVLHAVYTLLERIGYVFEICGPVAPQHLKMERLVNWSLQIRPFVLQRGVRQHLNFPMDISGYSLDEAKSYVHNLARLRFNAITFHSYPNQWIPGPQAGKDDLAGRFFYGYQYDIPETALFQNNIRNRQVFCIPEIEPFYNDEEKRSQMAVEWLNELMSECKRAGMTIRFSFEPRDMGTDTRQTLTTCETIMSIYPQIETLELLTEETGPWGLEVSEQSVRNVLITHFGEAVLKQRPVYDLLKPGQRGLDNLIGQLGHNIAAAQAFKNRITDGKRPKVVVGVYCVVPEYLRACLFLMRRSIPQDIGFAVLPAHSGQRVVTHLRQVEMNKADWQKSTVYSWIEFDGMMYLQQNGVTGIRLLLEDVYRMMGNEPVPSVFFNHWRTAENRVPMRYAALATLNGPQDEERFYIDYTKDLGITPSRLFSRAMQELGIADQRATDDLPNAGFCYLGCWKDGSQELGYLGKFEKDNLSEIGTMYRDVLDNFVHCGVSTEGQAAKDCLAFFENRLQCTVLYLKALEKGVELQPLCLGRNPGELSDDEKVNVLAICDQSLMLFEEYLAKHAEKMPDRGCEGTMISLYHTPMVHVKRMRALWGGVDMETPNIKNDQIAPPSPMVF